MSVCSITGCGLPHLARGYCSAHYTRWRKHGDPLAGRAAHGVSQQWLMDRKDWSGTECLIWPFGRDDYGYGMSKQNGKAERAHVTMCTYAHGPRPSDSHQAAHSCGNGKDGCVNPNHLRWATAKENGDDRVLHGTTVRGDAHFSARLSQADVIAIREMGNKVSRKRIAQMYGISTSHAGAIQRRKFWAWLESQKG